MHACCANCPGAGARPALHPRGPNQRSVAGSTSAAVLLCGSSAVCSRKADGHGLHPGILNGGPVQVHAPLPPLPCLDCDGGRWEAGQPGCVLTPNHAAVRGAQAGPAACSLHTIHSALCGGEGRPSRAKHQHAGTAAAGQLQQVTKPAHGTWEGHASIQDELAFAHRRHSAAEQGGGEQARAWP